MDKVRNNILVLLAAVAFYSCVPDKATYTNVEKSIFVTTERIDVDKYRIYYERVTADLVNTVNAIMKSVQITQRSKDAQPLDWDKRRKIRLSE